MDLNDILSPDADIQPEVRSAMERVHADLPAGVRMNVAWALSYTAKAALQNIAFFERGAAHFAFPFPVRVFLSHWTDAILTGFVPLDAVRDPHVHEWFVTFYEVPVEEAKQRLEQYPAFPYDGRNADLVRAQMLADGSIQQLLKRSAQALRERGIASLIRH